MNEVPMSDGAQSAVKSADRVLDLFELLAHSGREMSHGDIVEVLQIPKSSLSQLLKNLIGRGYVEVAPNGRGYRIGNSLLALSRSVGQVRDLAELSKDVLTALTRETGESSALNQLKGDAAEVVATVLGPARLVTHMRLGDLAPLYATSGGKAILAHMSDSFREDYCSQVKFEPATPATLKSVKALKAQLAAIRTSGFSYSHEEWTPGIVGVGMAVLDPAGVCLGAINVAIPAARYDDAMKLKAELALQRATDALRRHLAPGRPSPRAPVA
jgi:DNA-binding IclR family transcriptional regulator